MPNFRVKASEAGQRADRYLASRYPKFSRSSLKNLFSQAKVKLGSVALKPGRRLHSGDSLSVDDKLLNRHPKPPSLETIYEDEEVVVIDKPAGLLSHSKGALNLEPTVAAWLKNHMMTQRSHADVGQGDNEQRTKPYKAYGEGAAELSTQPRAASGGRVAGSAGKQADAMWTLSNRAGIVHRLDRATSGVMVLAKNQAALEFLQQQFASRRAEKTYLAIVEGELDPAAALIDAPIGRNPARPKTFKVTASGKPAQTKYQTSKTFTRNGQIFSLVELLPLTGRTHQLRVHLKYIGHPILGDRIYGQAGDKLYLHAQQLKLKLPSGQSRTFKAPLPAYFKEFMRS